MIPQTEFRRIRRYQRLLSVWGEMNSILNDGFVPEADAAVIHNAMEALRTKILHREQDHFDRTVRGE